MYGHHSAFLHGKHCCNSRPPGGGSVCYQAFAPTYLVVLFINITAVKVRCHVLCFKINIILIRNIFKIRIWPKTTINFAIRAYLKFMKIDALSLFSQQKTSYKARLLLVEKSQMMRKMGIEVGVDLLVFKKNAQN